MKSRDPATDLAERAIRQWQLRESPVMRPGQTEYKAQSKLTQVPQRAENSAIGVGSLGGFLGAIMSLGFNIAGAWLVGIEPLRLLRIYATIIEGSAALDMSRSDFVVAALMLHVVAGLLFGAIFAVGVRRFCCAGLRRYILAGAGYGVALWVVNFYGILSWLQPLLYGRALILTGIPIAVAVLTHISYGLTVALVIYPFQRDFMDPIQDSKKEK